MSSDTGVKQTLETVDGLGAAIREFAAKAEALRAQSRARAVTEVKTLEAEAKAQAARAAESQSKAETTFQQNKARIEARFEARKRRLAQAHKASRKKALDTIEEREGRQRYKLQSGANEAERRRDAGLKNADAVLTEFQQRSVDALPGLEDLERRAKRAFRGYRAFVNLLSPSKQWPEPDLGADEYQLFQQFQNALKTAAEDLRRFQWLPLPVLFRLLPFWLMTAAFMLWVLVTSQRFSILSSLGITWTPSPWITPAFMYVYLSFGGLEWLGRFLHRSSASAIAEKLAQARRFHTVGLEKAATRWQQDQDRCRTEFDETVRALNEQWQTVAEEAAALRVRRPREIDVKAARASARNESQHRARLNKLETERAEAIASLRHESAAREADIAARRAAGDSGRDTEARLKWSALEAEWNLCLRQIYDTIKSAGESAAKTFPAWDSDFWNHWSPPREFKNEAKFGRLDVDAWALAGVDAGTAGLALPGPASLSVPLSLAYPGEGSILFETGKTGGAEALQAINNIMFRLLSVTPPGKLSFTIFDPVGLGQNFAGLMHLADFEESLINSRIWTQSAQFEEKLSALNEHMEKVIQMYLRNEYATISEYNAQAGAIAEKYHFLVIADFPVNFTPGAARRLANIAASGARCGVHTIIQWDSRHALPQEFVPDELRKNSAGLVATERGFQLRDWRKPGVRLALDAPPSPESATEFLQKVGQSSRDSNRVEVAFSEVAPREDDLWSVETSEELRVPIGRSGATKLQYLAIGKGTRQHALIAGKTGSGKSTLFHVIITNLALWCSPEQVEFYLVDFKKGVEFKCYAKHRLPHARVVAIESDRDFGLSVLQRVDAELRRRGDLFRKLGVQDLAGYKRSGHPEPVPRSLLMIDEFQELFVEEDRISQGAAVLLDRIVRQGRAFGIHVLLGSQTLGGAYTLARATLGQMVIRIALQCNEADAYLIMDQDNPAPRLLSRPGEGIYNDAAGAIEGNSPFQAVWISDQTRDSYLDKVLAQAGRRAEEYPQPFIFEGNAPADARDNRLLADCLRSPAAIAPAMARVWLGAPNAIKGPTEARLQKQTGGNLLIVGQNEEPALAILATALVSLAAQFPVGAARFVVIDSFPPASPEREFLDRVIHSLSHEVLQPRGTELARVLGGLASEVNQPEGDVPLAATPRTFVLVQGLQNHGKLRQEDDFSFGSSASDSPTPAAAFLTLISQGPVKGVHLIVHCDTYSNAVRFLGRKTLGEFESRVLFQMSASDSASLIDSPDAGTLGLHRAILFNDREGSIETFRPYALPANAWLEEVAGALARQPAAV